MERFVSPNLLFTFMWHSTASYTFMFKSRGILNHFLAKKPTEESLRLTSVLLRFLGGLNIGYALLALYTYFNYLMYNQIRKSNLVILGVANFSQFYFDVIVHRNQLVNSKFLYKITIPDCLFALSNLMLAYMLFKEQRHKELLKSAISDKLLTK